MKFILVMLFIVGNAMAINVGVVDMKKILFTVKEGQKVKTELEKLLGTKRDELKKEEDKLQKSREQYQKQASIISADAKAKKERELQQSFVELQRKTAKFQEEIRTKEQSLTQPIIQKVYDVVEKVSATAGVDLTFDALTAPIIYAKNRKDITDDVIKAYDKAHPVK